MKIGLASDDDTVTAQQRFSEHIGTATAAIRSLLGRRPPRRKSEAWLSGYNAFYNRVSANPHAPDTEAHKDWELGSKAFDDDFEW